MRFLRSRKKILVVPLLLAFVVAVGTASVALAVCGPFTDVGTLICPFVISMYYLGITAGTTSTTYSPASAVTRGQMAIFMGALYNQVKRTENPSRVGRGQFGSPFGTNPYNGYTSVNTSGPNAIATNGAGLTFVSNFGTNVVDAFYGSYSHSTWNSYSGGGLSTGNDIITDNVDIYTLDNNGTSVVRIQLNNGAIIDPWATVAGTTGYLTNAGMNVGVSNSQGMAIINKASAGVTACNFGDTAGYGIAFDGSYFWVVDNFAGVGLWDQVDFGCNIVNNGALSGLPVGHIAFDGQNIWVPTQAGVINVIATKGAQGNTIVDTIPLPFGSAYGGGITFTGQHVIVAIEGDFGCGNPSDILVAYDAATHAFVDSTAGGPCNDGFVTGLAFDGRNIWMGANGINQALRIF